MRLRFAERTPIEAPSSLAGYETFGAWGEPGIGNVTVFRHRSRGDAVIRVVTGGGSPECSWYRPANAQIRTCIQEADPDSVKSNGKRPGSTGTRYCICGCGGRTNKFFQPGHDMRWKSWLKQIASGSKAPEELLTPEAVAKLGPWEEQGRGWVPTHTYKEVKW